MTVADILKHIAISTDWPTRAHTERFPALTFDMFGELMAHAAAENDPLWRLPLWRPYDEMLESKVADINNVGSGGQAGAITAALFMRRFVSAKSWAHFDVFAWSPRSRPGRPEGGECQAARAIYALLAARYG